jgi:Fe-S-cluster containining protein
MGVYDEVFKTMLWYGQLQPVPANWDGQKQHYRCGHYEQDIDGQGVCTIYEDRPAMCANFPYGPETWNETCKLGSSPIVDEGFDKCSWQVRWLDFEVVEGS